jgi:putative membrane-bound dehydrogenase-like protein
MLKRLALLFAPIVALAAPPLAPVLNDTALRLDLIATAPDVEACTTVCGDPAGAVYAGNDPRDGRLSTAEPACTIVRFSGYGPDRKKTVFADKLYSPAGSAWHDGWLYVIHDPLMTRFRDTDGDGIADQREDLIENLGVRPQDNGLNDHCASGFTLGMDGFWYISIGDRGTFETRSKKDGSTISLQGGGIIRCRLDGSQLEIFSTGTRNHLQVNLDAEDNAFTRDNTDDGNGWWTRLTHHIETGFYGYPFSYRYAKNYGVTQPSEQTLAAIKQHGYSALSAPPPLAPAKGDRENPPASLDLAHAPFLPAMADFGGGSPTGGVCYLSDGLPESYRGKHLFSEWGKAGLFATALERDGATFKLASDDKVIEAPKGGEFRPMQCSLAADGSVLIADWGYGGWKSPRVAGAIWRLSWPEAKIAPRLRDERKVSVEELLAALGHPDRNQRLRAQYELIRRGEPVEQAVFAAAKNTGGTALQRVHAMWVASDLTSPPKMNGTVLSIRGQELESLLTEFMASGDRVLAIQALRAIGLSKENWHGGRVGEKFAELIGSTDAGVRLAAITAAGRIGLIFPDKVAAHLLDEDPWVRFAAMTAIQRTLDGQDGSINGIPMPSARKELVKLLFGGSGPVQQRAWVTLATAFASPAVGIRLKPIDDPRFITAGSILITLDESFKSSDAAVRAQIAFTCGRVAYLDAPWDGHWWGTQPVKNPPPPKTLPWQMSDFALGTLTAALADKDTSVRLAAANAFSQFILGDKAPDAGAALRARLTAENDPAVRRQLIESIGVQKDAAAMPVFMKIALDEKADADFRETAIAAVVNIGGDPAKQTIAKLAGAQLSPAASRKLITAAGELKVLDAAPALIAHLKDDTAGNREAAAKSLQQLGAKSGATAALIEATKDKDGKAAAAAVEALGAYKDKAALPALIALAEKRRYQKETIQAISNMADESAIPVLVEALREKNTAVRRNALKALKPLQGKALPLIEKMLADGRVPAEIEPEIRNFFGSGAVTQWKMIGVFENVWEAQHPPEADALAHAGRPDLSKRYHNAEGKDAAWHDVAGEPGTGQVDLAKAFNSTAMVCAYAFTEIDTPEPAETKIFCGADDEIAVWLNGKNILNRGGSHGYEPDGTEVPVQLPAGKNALFVKIGNRGGTWVFNLRMPGFDNGKFVQPKETPESKQRAYALAQKPDGAWLNAGDPARGAKIFADPTGPLGGICATCHTVKGKGGVVGPDLSAIGANYKRPDLIVSIHEPSKTIALGFEQVLFELKSGDPIAGSLRGEAGDAFTVVDATGQSHPVKKADIKKRTDIPISLMPPGLTLALKPEEFVDLLSFLETLK